MKINFNKHSAGAWLTLSGAVIAPVTGVLSALGVQVDNQTLTSISGVISAIVSLLTALGILTAQPTRKKMRTSERQSKKMFAGHCYRCGDAFILLIF